ncbi:FG-GAP-like repeat-containing protein [Microlunatus capsulatus]
MRVLAAGTACLALSLTLLAPLAEAVPVVRPFDFDRNGHPDLVVGAPVMRVGTAGDAGGVVVYGATSRGLSTRGRALTQSTRGIPGVAERGDAFGASVASADFDHDGYADLAIGAPDEGVGAVPGAGAVTVVYGSRTGLDPRRSDAFSAPGGAATAARWGESLVAADLDLDGYPDLVVGTPGEGSSRGLGTGAVQVLLGGAHGVTTAGTTLLRGFDAGQDDGYDMGFGGLLAVGDLDGDGDGDLLVGSKGSNREGNTYPGSISVCQVERGGPGGCPRLTHELDHGLSSLAVGNVMRGPRAEVVVGSGGGDIDNPSDGQVTVLELAGEAELTVARTSVIDQTSPGVPGISDSMDGFGVCVVVGRLDRDSYSDLVVGVPGKRSERGGVVVVRGGASGWQTTGNRRYDQDTVGIPGKAEPRDFFGGGLALLDHDGDGSLDLTIGAFGENHQAGAVTVLRGSPRGITVRGARTVGTDSFGYRYRRAFFGARLSC